MKKYTSEYASLSSHYYFLKLFCSKLCQPKEIHRLVISCLRYPPRKLFRWENGGKNERENFKFGASKYIKGLWHKYVGQTEHRKDDDRVLKKNHIICRLWKIPLSLWQNESQNCNTFCFFLTCLCTFFRWDSCWSTFAELLKANCCWNYSTFIKICICHYFLD